MNILIKNCPDSATRKIVLGLFNKFESDNILEKSKYGFTKEMSTVLEYSQALRVDMEVKKNKVILKCSVGKQTLYQHLLKNNT